MCEICSSPPPLVEAFYADKEVPPVCELGAAMLKGELQWRLYDDFGRISRGFPGDKALANTKTEHAEAMAQLLEKLEEAKARYRKLGA